MSETTSIIDEKHRLIMARMNRAAKRANRKPETIKLVAVSKVQPDDRIQAMLDTGQRIFGENRVQEAKSRWGERFAAQRENIELRLIGPLQSNKVAEAVSLFDVIETVDREKLLKALHKAREGGAKLPRLYVQVNTGEEPQKAGILPKDLDNFITLMRDTYEMDVEGLMCIPPVNEAASPHFWFLKQLAERHGVEKLSMGMSSDFETAIEMGATSIRVGSALFGERDHI